MGNEVNPSAAVSAVTCGGAGGEGWDLDCVFFELDDVAVGVGADGAGGEEEVVGAEGLVPIWEVCTEGLDEAGERA